MQSRWGTHDRHRVRVGKASPSPQTSPSPSPSPQASRKRARAEPSPANEPESESAQVSFAAMLPAALREQYEAAQSETAKQLECMQKEIAVLKEQVKIQEKVKREIIHTRKFELFVLHAIVLSTIVAGVQSYNVQHVILDVLVLVLTVFIIELLV